jgi:hypothetical protein
MIEFLSRYYGQPFRLICDEERYRQAAASCKINYSFHAVEADEIWIHPHPLLFESIIRPVKVECFHWRQQKAFFKSEGSLGFDLLAASFYLLSRYEEYLPHEKDTFGRYDHRNAVAWKEGFLQLPLVNLWLEQFREMLIEKNPVFRTPVAAFSFLPTYDIDRAWNYLHNGWFRNTGGFLKELAKAKWQLARTRLRVLRHKQQDPFDAYEWLDGLHEKYGLDPLYFFLVAVEKGRYDNNIDTGKPALQQLIRRLSQRYRIGIHPSWASGDTPSLLQREIDFIKECSAQPVTASRQHFIRMELPETYRRLLAAGIREEHSMGYGTTNGFRASFTASYYWYDLKAEEGTDLRVRPFCFMDANAYYEQKQRPEEAFDELLKYYQVIREVNGEMITLWHNDFLGTGTFWKGWREQYERFLAHLAAGQHTANNQ